MLPVFDQARIKDVSHQTDTALLTTVLALRAYRAERGRYPHRLDELVAGGYLRKIPDDPCALAGPVRYRRTGSRYLLYSVGADGKDDNGRPVNNPKRFSRRGEQTHFVEAGTVGDYVVGLNTY